MTKRMDWSHLLSTKRVSEFDKCAVKKERSQYLDPRSPFEKDFDQIIYSYAFRRLQDKTQVIPFPEYDFVHTRLTHSLEVASIGRSLGRMAANLIFKELDEDFSKENNISKSDIGALVAASCLAHDIGNPPFGHSGESAISYHFKNNNKSKFFRPFYYPWNAAQEDEKYFYFKKLYAADESEELVVINKSALIEQIKYWQDLSNFEGNANGFRILTKNCERGINPTAALLGTFSKYPKESFIYPNPYNDKPTPKSFSKYGFFQSERILFKQIAETLGLLPVSGINEEDVAFHRHPLCYLMEASDDIAYGMIDFEDGCRLGLIDYDKHYKSFKFTKKNKVVTADINSTPLDILKNIASIDSSFDATKVDNTTDYKNTIAYLRTKVINVLIHECFKVFEANYEAIMTGNYTSSLINDVKNPIITESLFKMECLVRKYVYNYPPVLQSEASGFEVMDTLIDSLAISSDICFSCGDEESERAKKLNSLLPEEYQPRNEKDLQSLNPTEIYERVLSVLDYVSGMTDNYAMALYRKIKGISHR